MPVSSAATCSSSRVCVRGPVFDAVLLAVSREPLTDVGQPRRVDFSDDNARAQRPYASTIAADAGAAACHECDTSAQVTEIGA
jgi:hypothetical protein